MRQRALGRQASHHDEMIENFASHGDVGDSQIDVRSQAAVEIDLAAAVLGSGGRGREVGEVESKRLAQFEHVLAEEEEDRDMCLTYGTIARHLHRRATRIVLGYENHAPTVPLAPAVVLGPNVLIDSLQPRLYGGGNDLWP